MSLTSLFWAMASSIEEAKSGSWFLLEPLMNFIYKNMKNKGYTQF
ncbi:hypothetical protein QLS71_002565 [Mariniflexile litorale]|uniref:Uncharacterized protein n=1 Tax=Mariniflexile litorale TaxID=3045158 RepID=A0AAU7ELY8_9FLAO